MVKLKLGFSDFWGGFDYHNNFWTITLNKLNIPWEIVYNDFDLLITSCFGDTFKHKKTKKKIYWTGENHRVDNKLNDFDLVYSFDFNDNEKHYRLPLYLIDCIDKNVEDFKILRSKNKDKLYEEFKDKKFCTFFHRNGNSQFRNNYFYELNKIGRVDSYGSLFNNTDNIYLDWTGKIKKSSEYKFTHCFENSIYEGYITEKIMDGFRSDIIPIYWGGSLIHQEFNTKSFINVHEYGIEESLKLVKNMSENFDLYWEFYREPIISNNQKPLEVRILDFQEHFNSVIQTI